MSARGYIGTMYRCSIIFKE
uniref:Uncharacterized protein n=1 Tax=Arundo donax TaxID=35708 RepID=A0A0A8YDY6_ARUDO